jgi:bifunctional non-homologous end joining protein LigD
VATPLDWKEVKRGIRPMDFRIDNTIERFKRVGDLFAPVLAGGQKLEDALQKVGAKSEEEPATPKPAKRTRKTAKRA